MTSRFSVRLAAVAACLGMFTLFVFGALSAQGVSTMNPPESATSKYGNTSLELVVAIVGADLSVKPIPLHELHLLPRGGSDSLVVRTGLDGRATVPLRWGIYDVRSAVGVSVNGTQYLWSVPVEVLYGKTTRLELTNANADSSAVAPTVAVRQGRQMAPEMDVYQAVRAGVYRIESGLAHGSGFLVDRSGLILTNAHVVEGQTTAAAVIDSVTRIPLQILYRQNESDIAVLRAAPSAVLAHPVLSLSRESPPVQSGERILAIGYPLNQEQSLTSGIVSSVREGAIISDVNINHGNSGGPMLNLAGEVVGINTFGDFTSQGGPGISGAILIAGSNEPLRQARGIAATRPAPPDTLLPSIPTGRFSTQQLVSFAESVDARRYERFDAIAVGRFNVSLTTPPITYVRQKAFEISVAKDRKKREARAGLSEEERFSEMRNIRDWQEYVGDQRAPVITVSVEPQLRETGGSTFRRLLITGAGGKATIRFSGDLRSARIFRNGAPVPVLKGGTTPVKAFIDNRIVNLKDVANYGYYILPAEVFRPEPDGTPPSIVVFIDDLKNPGELQCRELPKDVVPMVWNDFEPYFTASGKPFIHANENMKNEVAPKASDLCRQLREELDAATIGSR